MEEHNLNWSRPQKEMEKNHPRAIPPKKSTKVYTIRPKGLDIDWEALRKESRKLAAARRRKMHTTSRGRLELKLLHGYKLDPLPNKTPAQLATKKGLPKISRNPNSTKTVVKIKMTNELKAALARIKKGSKANLNVIQPILDNAAEHRRRLEILRLLNSHGMPESVKRSIFNKIK